VRSGKGLKSAVGPRSAAPAPRLEQPFQILTSGDEQADHGDLGETAEAELAEAVPLLRCSKQWLDPDAPFSHRLSIAGGLVISPDPVQVGFVKAAGEAATLLAVGAALLEGTGVAGAGRCLVGSHPGGVVVATAAQDGAVLAGVDVLLVIVGECLGAEEAGAFADGRERDKGVDAGLFQCADVVDGALGRVTDRAPGMEVPPKPDSPEEVLHRDVLHDVGRGDERGENDPCLAAIDDVVVVVAQRRRAAIRHERGIGVGRADAQIGLALIALDRRAVGVQASLVEELPDLGPLGSEARLVLWTEPRR